MSGGAADNSGRGRRPRIGIVGDVRDAIIGPWDEVVSMVPHDYVSAIAAAGGAPVIIPSVEPYDEEPDAALDDLDGIVFMGGKDFDAQIYGAEPHPENDEHDETRDRVELAIGRAALERRMPILGICRGFQLLNILYGGDLEQHLGDRLDMKPHRAWNAPFMLATWRVGPALAAGDTVVLKPPEWAPLTCSLLGDLAEEAELPPGVLNIVHGGPETGALLTGHAGVDRIAFTGSPATARTVGAAAAAELTPVSFELGGKSPLLVFADADLEAAARTAAYQYDNSGQVCLAGTRLLVERSCLDAFMERFLAEVEAIRVGDPREAATTYGPLIHPRALARVEAHVEKALAQGAALRFGGKSRGGLYYPPTLFTDVPSGADILREEVFGPVLTLQTFEGDEEAIALAESTDYGLAAMIFTGGGSRAGRLSRRISAGTIWVNCFYVRDLETPFGGTKHSGIGREGGRHSFDFYCDVKTVCERTAAFAATGTGGGS